MIKHFTKPEDYYAEVYAYRLKLPMLPRILEENEPNWLRIERIFGTAYMDTEINPEALAQTIATFHASTFSQGMCLCHIDNQPQNILRTEKGYSLIDFSESKIDYPERDISHLLLFWAADLPTSVFESLSSAFIHRYRQIIPLTNKQWEISLAECLDVFDKRRNMHKKPGGKNLPEIQETNRRLLSNLLVSC